MKELGEKLRTARENTGITIEEAAGDLNYKASQLEEIENGNYKDFKDKFLLKTILSDYAKYLGFDVEEIIDEFNDFVFESTSKIPIDEITKANKKVKDTDEKIASPYTADEQPKKVPLIIIVSLIVLLAVFLAIFCYNIFFKDSGSSSFDVSYIAEGNNI